MAQGVPDWLAELVAEFGATSRAKLMGPGEREANIRAPIERLLVGASEHLHRPAVFHDEVPIKQRRVRPDFALRTDRAITGYLEVKAPGRPIDPAGFTGRELRQWELLRDLPNLIYSNGAEWRLYRHGDPLGAPMRLADEDLPSAGEHLTAPPELSEMLKEFLLWRAKPITSVGRLVREVAPLTRLLRGEVLDQLDQEQRAVRAGADRNDQPFLGLAQDWRALLFPDASDEVFADGYAQTVTFALLLARTSGITLAGKQLHDVGVELSEGHSLMGKALQLLTDDVASDFEVTLDLLVRVVEAVDWRQVRRGRRDMYLHLYEHFLELYDKDLRQASGTYYTPHEVVDQMVRLTESVLESRLGKAKGFADPDVFTVDPAMGTGAYLQTVLRRAADRVRELDGPGQVPGALAEIVKRCVGFELQMGPYTVAELRVSEVLADQGVPPDVRSRLYVTDTLDDPHVAETQLAATFAPIAHSRRRASEIKRRTNVTVVIGNPPYGERAEGRGGWVERGGDEHGTKRHAILDDFRLEGNGRVEYVLKNFYVYFWRWATWKVWESTGADIDGDAGVVCFISTAGYLRGPGFKGMRSFLRRESSEGWIIDLTPEGQTPDVPTRIFPGVRQPLAIGVFVRQPDNDPDLPATVHYRAVRGRQAEKFTALGEVALDDDGWRETRTAWTAPLTPAADSAWDSFPALGDLMPWVAPGVKPNRAWVYAPSESILMQRWRELVAESDQERKSELFKESRDANLDRIRRPPLDGPDVVEFEGPFRKERRLEVHPVRVGYRAFDRQWIIPDRRLLHGESPTLWSGRIAGQVFAIEQHAHPIDDGPGVVFTALIPDMHHFNNRGGRALPHLHPDGSPNLARHLVIVLRDVLDTEVEAADVLAYIAGVVAQPAFTERFADELTTPGIRVPMTRDRQLWHQAVTLGRQVIWLHTYAEAFAGDNRPQGTVRLPPGDPRQPTMQTALTDLPEAIGYDAERHILRLGSGEFGPVEPAVEAYTVGGRNVLRSWFNYRKKNPGGRRSSPLDETHEETWPSAWSTELIDLLTVLSRLVELEPAQADLLDRVLDGELVSRTALANAGTRWPTGNADRRPHFGYELSDDPDGQTTLDL